MNKQEAIRKELNRYNRNSKIIDSLPNHLDIDFIGSGGLVFIKEYNRFNKIKPMLDSYEIRNYYFDYNKVCITLFYKETELVLYCSEIEKTDSYLESIGAQRV